MNTLAYEFRFYPTNEQKHQLAQEFGCSRFVFNWALGKKKTAYQLDKKNLSINEISRDLTKLKQEKDWLKIASRTCLTASLRNLDTAFTNFFKSCSGKRKGEKVGFPKFKNKDSKKSVSYQDITYENGILKIPKLGKSVNVNWHRQLPIDAKILRAHVKQDLCGGYFVSITFETETDFSLEPIDEVIGIDLGIKTYCVTSNGDEYSLPSKKLKKLQKRIKRYSSKVSKAKNGSKRHKKYIQKKRKTQLKSDNIKKDFVHKLTHKLVTENQVICIESLKIKQMQQNKQYSSFIQQMGWGEFYRCLKYKAVKFDRYVIQIDQYYPSSKLCSSCGLVNPEIRGTKIRRWICPQCGADHDRDINAAMNILNEGLRII